MHMQWNLSITITYGPMISGCFKELVWSFVTLSLNYVSGCNNKEVASRLTQ